MTDLSLVPIDEIIDELEKRYDTICLLTNKILSDDQDDIMYHFKDRIGCLGLIRIADQGLKNGYKDVIDETE